MKEITLENLIAGKACEPGLDFVTPILEANGDVASELLAVGRFDWFEWLVQKGYNVESARRSWRTWDENGYLILTGGDCSTLTGGTGSTLTGGDCSTLTGGEGSALTGGRGSILTGGNCSILTGGDDSILTGGDYSELTGGNCSILTGGEGSRLTGGDHSDLSFRYWDGARSRIVVAYVGENGIEPNVAYKLDESGRVVRAEEAK